ncbi:MAG: exosortase/archaeosortase family protein [Bacteroidales bacterium]
MPSRNTVVRCLVLLAVAFAVVYGAVVLSLVHNWVVDDNYSHAFVLVPAAAYLAWLRRADLAAQPLAPSFLGLLVVVVSLVVFAAGTLGAEVFLARISMLGVAGGTILFVAGRRHLAILAFPLGLLLLVVPLPALLFNQVAFPLQLLASRLGEWALWATGVPVLREGNVITLAHTRLEVAEACSGIRSLMSLVALALLYGYFSDPRPGVRAALAAVAVPVAIVVNGLRIAGTGLLAQQFGAQAAEGFFHAFSGWLMFVAAFALLVAAHRVIAWEWPQPAPVLAAQGTES